MSLVRRCDGCREDIVDDLGTKGPKPLVLRIPNAAGLWTDLDFHNTTCLGLWLQKEV